MVRLAFFIPFHYFFYHCFLITLFWVYISQLLVKLSECNACWKSISSWHSRKLPQALVFKILSPHFNDLRKSWTFNLVIRLKLSKKTREPYAETELLSGKLIKPVLNKTSLMQMSPLNFCYSNCDSWTSNISIIW